MLRRVCSSAYTFRQAIYESAAEPRVPAATFLYHPEPGPFNTLKIIRLMLDLPYKNTDHRGKTFPGYRLFFQMETHSQRPSDDVAVFSDFSPNRAEPNTERNPSSGPSEQESSSAMHYLGLKPLPTSLNASWRSDYMMMDLPVKKAGIITKSSYGSVVCVCQTDFSCVYLKSRLIEICLSRSHITLLVSIR